MTHPWLKDYPIESNSKRLIIGTHPPMPYNGNLKFYYGNMNEFWRLMSEVYIDDEFYRLGKIPELIKILSFLKKHEFSITDLVYETKDGSFSVDNEMIILKLNPFLYYWLRNSNINEIYFTSFNSNKNSAFSLFKRWLKENQIPIKISPVKNWIADSFEIELFGRKIRLFILYSPSPTARRGIPRSKYYIQWSLKTTNPNVDDFRIWWYKKKFLKED